MSRYLELLGAAARRSGSHLCVGIDPVPDAIPVPLRDSTAGIWRWIETLIDATAPHATAFKMNIAYFEALGSDGARLAEQVRARIPAHLPLIVDAKRGDIGATVAAQGAALFDRLGADAVTANPYLGIGALAPLLDRPDRFTYLLCRTSNPEAGDVQSLVVGATPDAPGESLAARIARLAAARPEAQAGRVGLVVGATDPTALREIREVAPELPFLVPGVGAQGGAADDVIAAGGVRVQRASLGTAAGLLVNVGRGITDRVTSADRASAELDAAAAEWGRRLAILAP